MKRDTTRPLLMVLAFLLALGIGAAAIAQQGAQGFLDSMSRDYEVPEILPPGVQLESEFAPAQGEPVGVADLVQNDVWVIHAASPGVAYKARKESPVFQGDTLITGRQAACVITLKDQSSLTLGALTRLVIDRSVYDPEKNERESVFSMLWGKVRCLVRKIASTGKEDFKLNTPMATVGVRGSDFVVALVPPDEAATLHKGSWLPSLELVPSAYAQPATDLATFVAAGPQTTLSFSSDSAGMQILGPNTFASAFQDRMFTTPFPPGAYSQLLSRMNMAQLPVLRMPELLE